MNTGERIKQRRIELGLSVDEVASRLGKNRATVYRYESNDIENLPTTVLEPLAKILETTPAYLMGWNRPIDSIIDEFSYLKEQFLNFPQMSENKIDTREISNAINKVFEMNEAILKTGRITCLFDENEAIMGLKFILSYYHINWKQYDDKTLISIVKSNVFKDFISNILNVYNQSYKVSTLNAAHARTDIDIPNDVDTSDDDIMDDENF